MAAYHVHEFLTETLGLSGPDARYVLKFVERDRIRRCHGLERRILEYHVRREPEVFCPSLPQVLKDSEKFWVGHICRAVLDLRFCVVF